MADLSTTYLGLTLRNPIIAGASKLTANVDKIKAIVDAGASAVVCTSLFEEQIQLERLKLDETLSAHDNLDAEVGSMFPNLSHSGPDEHLMWVRRTVEAVDVPVIASLNAVDPDNWVDYAVKLADTGAAALELNFFHVPGDMDRTGEDIVAEQVDTLAKVADKVSLPVSVKLSYFYSNVLNVVKRMDAAGVGGFVLFNRLFESDVDLEKEKHTTPLNLSHPGDNRLPMRYVGLLFGHVAGSLCLNTGVLTGADLAKATLVGADAVQIVSAIYKSGATQIASMLEEAETWMSGKGYAALADFRGKLARANVTDPYTYKRAQYVDLLLRSEELLDAPSSEG